MAQTRYLTEQDLHNRLSAEGVALRVDDGPPDDLGDVIDDASSLIEEYCWQFYDAAQLAQSEWVKQRATDLAAQLLCERRGNPAPVGVARRHDRAVESLEMVREGKLRIPWLPLRRTCAPRLANQRARLEPVIHVVTEKRRSTVKAKNYRQHDDKWEFFDYSI